MHVWWPFAETKWDGLSTADLVFPFFLFIMGSAIGLALSRHGYEANGGKVCANSSVWIKVLRRGVVLFLLGVAANLQASDFTFDHFRIMGVLERLGICYFIVAFLCLVFPLPVQRGIMLLFATAYLALMYGLEVPDGCGRGNLTPYCNAGAYVDRSVWGRDHMMWPNDSEGLVSTLTATLTTYIGYEGGLLLCATRGKIRGLPVASAEAYGGRRSLVIVWSVLGTALTTIALVLLPLIPFNKKIYSFNFALFTGGIGTLLLCLMYFLMDLVPYSPPSLFLRNYVAPPFVWVGVNPLAVFLGMLELEILLMWNISASHHPRVSAWSYIWKHAFNSWIHPPAFSSSAMAFAVLLLWLAFAYVLQRNNLYFKL